MNRTWTTALRVPWIVICLAATARAADPPGVVIDRSPDFARVYVGCPSIAVVPDGSYVASHSWFGPGTPNRQSAVFTSADRGKTWKHVADIDGQWWSTLFTHNDTLYIMGVSERYGHAVIRRSTDGGRTWTDPKDEKTGLLLADVKYHCAPVPVVVHQGRVWRAYEDAEAGGGWGRHFRALVVSAPIDADLLDASNWTVSNCLHLNPEWLVSERPGWLEGNVVVTPEGGLVNVLRVNDDRGDTAAIVRISPDARTLTFDPEKDFIDFPGGRCKFTIRFDPVTKRYWSLVNKQLDPTAYRNVLALTSSADLREWKVESIILRHVEKDHHAWQYVDWLFDGDDLIAASRTAWDGSHNAHDANYFTFHRIERFRELSMDDSPPWLGRGEKVTHEHGDLQLEGHDFRVRPFGADQTAFGNRTYVWKEVPERFEGWTYTQTDGGVPAEIVVKAKRDTTLTIATATKQTGIDVTGWSPVDGLSFHYTDRNKNRMAILQKQLAAGEEIVLPQGNWTGSVVLLPPERK